MSVPLITASLIVRNEAAHLPACLSSIAGVVDEVVIVDTGSTDATVDIARSFGAKVFHRPWDDDFAAARNHGLDRCTGDWILYIDADERLRPASRPLVERLLAAKDHVAYRIGLRSAAAVTAYWEYRVFRNDPRIRFRNRIHETMLPDIMVVAASDGLRISDVPELVLDHVGYEGDQSHKHRRNKPLLEAQIATNPARVYNWWHLGAILRDEGDREGAVRAWEQGLAKARSGGRPLGEAVTVVLELVRDRIAQGEPWADLIDEALGWFPEHRLLHWFQARRLMDEQRWEEAIAVLHELAATDPDTLIEDGGYDRRIFGAFAQESIGTCCFRLGRFAESAAAFAAAEALDPEFPGVSVRRRLAEIRASQGGLARAG